MYHKSKETLSNGRLLHNLWRICKERSRVLLFGRGVGEEPVLFARDGGEADARGSVDLGEDAAAVLAHEADRVSPERLQIAHAAHEIMRTGPLEDRFPDR